MQAATWDPVLAPPSELAFSQVREDADVELAVVADMARRLGRPVRVAMVASGGCTALALLAHPWVAKVEAIDINPAQLHLLALREAALRHLPLADAWLVQGIEPEAPPENRLVAYAQLREHLSEATRAHWDARPGQVAFGLHRVGRYEALFRGLAADLTELGFGAGRLPQGLQEEKAFLGAFERAFEPGKLSATFGEAAVAFSMQRSFASHFAGVFRQALGRWTPEENPFLHQVYFDRYAPGQAPAYLQASGQGALQARAPGRLGLHAGHFTEVLADLVEAEGPFDVIHASNLSDWVPPTELKAFFTTLRSALVPAGAFVGRRLNGDHELGASAGERLRWDTTASTAWKARDRSFFYSELVLAYRPGVGA